MRRIRRSLVPAIRISITGLLLYALGAAVMAIDSGQPAQTGTILLTPQDTYLKTDAKNYSTSTTLPVYTWPDNKAANAILLKFDLSAIPAGAVVNSATLHLRLVANDAKPETTYTVTAHKVLGRNPNVVKATGQLADTGVAWTANTCCSGGVPLAQADISPAYDTKAINKVKEFKSWTITTMVQEWMLNPASNFGVLLNPDTTRLRDRYRTFASMEYTNTQLRPYLKVTYVAGDATPPAVSVTAPAAGDVSGVVAVAATASDNAAVAGVQLKVNGAALGSELTASPYTVNWDTTALSDGNYALTAVARDTSGNSATSAAVGVTVRNGVMVVSPQDTSLNINANNYSADTTLTTYTWPDFQAANTILMKFDLSALPANALVQEARVHLALTQADALPTLTYGVSAAKVLNHNPVISLATGYTADGATGWTPNNCCYNGVPLAQADISPPYDTVDVDKVPGFKSWNITMLVQGWLTNPAANFGLLLGSDAAKARDHYRYFASMEHADPSLRPYLRVLYSLNADATPPVIGGVTSSGVTQNAATINWTTDEAANSQAEYGFTTAYGSVTPLDGALVTAHTMALSGLTDGKQYHYRVRSRDQAGNLATSADLTFATPDGTSPSVSVTAPAAGATVSGTISVTANAGDNVGVAGVQFTLDGANYGAEDTAAPYSTSWNTSGIPDGSHTLTAVARDAAGNVTNSAAVIVTVSNAPPPPPPPGAGIAASYPGDVGIENDPNVVFVERFDEATMANLFARWTDISNGSGMSITADAPAGSPAGKSLTIPWSGTSTGGHLYRRLAQGVDDTLYVRYYVKYPASNSYNHTGIWMGGYNPPIDWPNPQAGVKPTGSDRFSAAVEQNNLTNRFDHYDYWMGMRQSSDGGYWGNLLLNDPNVQAAPDQWTCVEQMVKLNNPVTALNGEHALWLNGVKVSHLGQGFPNGSWFGGIFTQNPAGSPFQGLQWRSTASLNLNWIWLQVYATSGAGNLKYAHVVAAKSYIGCLASGSPSPTLPTVSMTAPAQGATVSGTIPVSANASDSVGVAGVQFKLDGANLGVEDTSAPYSVSWDTATGGNGSHTLTAIARNTAGLTTTASTATVTVSNPVGGAWPNEPAGMTRFNDQPWDVMVGNGWNYLRRSATLDSSIQTDATPFSPTKQLQVTYTPGCCIDAEPGVHWITVPQVREIFTGYWVKLSPNWIPNPAGGGKISFLFTDVGGQVYTNYYHPSMDGSVQGPPYRIGINTEWAPYGQQIWLPNVSTTWINNGEWHRLEFYYRWETTPGVSGDGVLKWWVDGQLNGHHTNVHYPAAFFQEFQIAPTVQFAGPEMRHMFFDHVYISVK